MLKICKEKWHKNNHVLRENIKNFNNLYGCEYVELVRLAVDSILNSDEEFEHIQWDTSKITVIDNGDYQGTQMFLIPSRTYQPAEYEYIMTYAGYGSCSGCDTLEAIQSMIPREWDFDACTMVVGQISDTVISDLMTLCKHLIENIVKPYNCGWRSEEDYTAV